jgi:uncharacterized membrane protein HdeD (DUF308 family)
MNWKNWKVWAVLSAVVLLIVAVVLWFTLPTFRAVVAEVLVNIAALAIGFGCGWYYKKKKG